MGSCREDGCDEPIHARRMCKRHYATWYRARNPDKIGRYNAARRLPNPSHASKYSPRFCSTEGCGQPHWGRGLCKRHYFLEHELSRSRAYEARPDVRARKREADRQRRQDPVRRADKQAYQREWVAARKDWGAWWETHRQHEDQEDLKAEAARQDRRQRRIERATRPLPSPRRFIAGRCLACSAAWIDYPARRPSGYCNRCQAKRWAADSRHKRRAWKANSAVLDVISPGVVFKRDQYRCQICGRKTQGTHPDPRSPTVDHIVPLAKGGDHSYLNVQCACFACNTRKGAGRANDQLRLLA